MREIDVKEITDLVKDMCIESNHMLSSDMVELINSSAEKETNETGKNIFSQIIENLKISEKENIPMCQDTGMAVVFIDVGQDVHFIGGDIKDAINFGVRAGYEEGYLRKSVVSDPVIRNNTNDNTPAIIHYNIVPGDKVKITFMPKGFGSENMSRIFMLKPADGIEGIKKSVLEAAVDAGPNACPPFVIGVGIGGTFEKSALLAKEALINDEDKGNKAEWIKQLEKELLDEINNTGIGPSGLGGDVTALSLKIKAYPTHIAGMPVAVNICCHVNRHVTKIL